MKKEDSFSNKGLTLLQELDKNTLSLVRTLGLLGCSLFGSRVELFCSEDTQHDSDAHTGSHLKAGGALPERGAYLSGLC